MAKPWNLNIHYDGELDGCVPARAASVLEVGCGDGFLAARLSQRVSRVVAVDIDQPLLARAKQRFPTAQVAWTHRDFLETSERQDSFDAVVSTAPCTISVGQLRRHVSTELIGAK